ncbi:hypothetical protein SAMN05216214_1069 [Atopomonas hussainii]|uniref:Uncharacterized protein n=1 Tax=Atopomonas hussainii TaxID=1429083 RepID=A0A1H7KLT8_9GAMM|nr:hypothetical protein [Atopomonas hussainii]SEK87486.1 hypothetical protein SAMN05216214_1069 [Atopomonas hussainii]
MKPLVIASALLVITPTFAQDGTNSFATFAQCAGLMESEHIGRNYSNYSSKEIYDLISTLEESALITDKSKTIFDFYQIKNEGHQFYEENQKNTHTIHSAMFNCLIILNDAINLVHGQSN